MRRAPAPLLPALLAGAVGSSQAFVLGRFATSIGSAELAASVTFVVAGIVLFAVVVVTGALGRAVRCVRAGARVRWWHLIAGANGGFAVVVISSAVSKVGVALLTVALVCGQTVGGLVVDRMGLSPAGKVYLSAPRLLGVALALTAVVIAGMGSSREVDLGLMGLAMLSGAGFALQQAAIGHIANATGEPVVAAWWNTMVSVVVIVLVWLAVSGGSAAHGWSAPAVQWLVPGLCAAAIWVIVSKVVERLGVLRLTLAFVAGQYLAALALDLIAPVPGQPVTIRTVLGVVLTLIAVAVSGASGTGNGSVRRAPDPVHRTLGW